MISKILTLLMGTKQSRDLRRFFPLIKKINSLESEVKSYPQETFIKTTQSFKDRYLQGESLDSMLPLAFALVREAAVRTLGERPFDVQLLGGIVLHHGGIMEMKTGDGKTLSSVLAAYLNSLTGEGVHIVTVNDYLAERDSEWMGQIYDYLGVSVGVILSHMDTETRRTNYGREITYGTNNELGFDYLRDNMVLEMSRKSQRLPNFCIVDEIDSILIDEARTPLIISGPAEDDTVSYYEVNKLVVYLSECAKDPATGEYPEEPSGDYKIDEKRKHITFTDQGMNHIEEILHKRSLIKGSLFDYDNFEYIHYFTQSLKARKLFHKDKDYVVQEGKVEIVDEFTGRILHGRRYSDGLHQAIEAKENIRVAERNRTMATITFQNYFRMYKKLSGMTGTADTEAKEFAKIYNLDVFVLPTNRPVIRKDHDDLIFLTESDKLKAISDEITSLYQKGQPVLVGTISIEKSEQLSHLLHQNGIKHEVLNAKNHSREALIISEAGAQKSVTIATNMAGRGTDIKLGGNTDFRARHIAGTNPDKTLYQQVWKTEYDKWLGDYQKIKELGGLHVLGTERHESRRIDNQLRGRSGRQGDPGSSRFFISMDDELMRLFGGENLKNIMSSIGMREGEPIMHPWINKSIAKAQTRVEERNFEIRKHLLDFDDVLNEQRNFIYTQRDAILTDTKLINRIVSTMKDIIEDIFDEHSVNKRGDFETSLNVLKEEYFFVPKTEEQAIANMEPEEFKIFLFAEVEEQLKLKADQWGSDNLNLFIRGEYLRSIDQKWQDHLENLDALREAVNLRAFAQKNPLLEYKLEGFQIFDQMIYDIRKTISRKILNVQMRTFEGINLILEREQMGSAKHRVLGQFSGPGPSRPGAAMQAGRSGAPAAAKVQVTRQTPKVGRNEPCPCGSGKKYKHCHGA